MAQNIEMAELKENKRKNGNLSLKPLKFEEAVKAIVKVKPQAKTEKTKPSG
jgi:hypothetical protein